MKLFGVHCHQVHYERDHKSLWCLQANFRHSLASHGLVRRKFVCAFVDGVRTHTWTRILKNWSFDKNWNTLSMQSQPSALFTEYYLRRNAILSSNILNRNNFLSFWTHVYHPSTCSTDKFYFTPLFVSVLWWQWNGCRAKLSIRINAGVRYATIRFVWVSMRRQHPIL